MSNFLYIVAILAQIIEFQGTVTCIDVGINEEHTYFHVTGVSDFFNYGSLELFELNVPLLTTSLHWSLMGSRSDPSCPLHKIMVFVQHGSYPLIPAKNNKTYPSHFFLERTNNHSWALITNDSYEDFTVESPRPGSWFGAAYVIQTRENRVIRKIGQVDCDYRLHVNVTTLYMDDLPQLVPNTPNALHYQGQVSHYYRFFINDVTWQYEIIISECSVTPCPLLLASRSGAMPRRDAKLTDCGLITARNQTQCVTKFIGAEVLQWHYLVVKTGPKVSMTEKISFTLEIRTSECNRHSMPIDLIIRNRTRRSIGTLHRTSNDLLVALSGAAAETEQESHTTSPQHTPTHSTPTPAKSGIHTTDHESASQTTKHHHHHHKNVSDEFSHNRITDLLGKKCFPIERLSRQEDMNNEFYVVYSYSPKSSDELIHVQSYQTVLVRFDVMPIKDMAGTLHFVATYVKSRTNLTVENVTVDICVSRGVIPTNGTQFYCPTTHNAVHLTMDTSGRMRTEQSFPYPEPGAWYISMQSTCYRNKINSTEREVTVCSQPYYLVEFLVNNAPCLNSHCSNNGGCSQYTRGIYTLSSCNCGAGYRGYNCDDDSEAKKMSIQLTNTLCLTLSNLCFLPAIVIACYRRFLVEALVYFANMFFSTFYHACDMGQWSVYKLCIMPYHVLSYCDFFLSIMSFWMTLMAAASIPQWLRSLSHMVGVIALAMAVEWAEHSPWSNITAILTGVMIVLISWFVQCGRRRKMYPPKRQCLWMLPGLVLALIGLAIFGLIETDPNYPYTHSAWHACMSLAIVFLLPRRRQPLLTSKDENSSDEFEFSERNSSINRKNTNPVIYDDDDDDDDLPILP